MTVYKIRNTKTGLYSGGGKYRQPYNKNGKIWLTWANLQSHIDKFVKGIDPNIDDLEIVEYDMKETNIISI